MTYSPFNRLDDYTENSPTRKENYKSGERLLPSALRIVKMILWITKGEITGEKISLMGHLSLLTPRVFSADLITGGGDFIPPEQFKLSLPQRTNYLYGRITKSLPEMYAFTLCMWIKSSASPGIGTPFSYGVPGQANEIVLIEWGNNPIELLINDKASN